MVDLWINLICNSRDSNRKNRMNSNQSPGALRATNARRALQEGHYHKAIQSLSSLSLADTSDDTFHVLLAKHPQSPPPHLPPDPVPAPITVPESLVLHSIKSFPPGPAPGPSGLRAEHLKEAVLCPSPIRASSMLKALHKLVNLGSAPSCIMTHLCGASLLASIKKDGGLRPIAVGEVLRCLTAKCLARASNREANCILAPLQVGVGVPGGTEAAIHALRNTQKNVSTQDSDKWVLLLDFANAFNSIDREIMQSEVQSRLPGLSAWFQFCYSNPSSLLFGTHTLDSCCGLHQGDPLGPLGFALTLHPIIERIAMEVPHLLANVWYMDDGILCGSGDDLL